MHPSRYRLMHPPRRSSRPRPALGVPVAHRAGHRSGRQSLPLSAGLGLIAEDVPPAARAGRASRRPKCCRSCRAYIETRGLNMVFNKKRRQVFSCRRRHSHKRLDFLGCEKRMFLLFKFILRQNDLDILRVVRVPRKQMQILAPIVHPLENDVSKARPS